MRNLATRKRKLMSSRRDAMNPAPASQRPIGSCSQDAEVPNIPRGNIDTQHLTTEQASSTICRSLRAICCRQLYQRKLVAATQIARAARGMLARTNLRRISEDILKANVGLEAYIDKGARTTVESHQGELAHDGVPSDRAFVPRRARLAPDDFRGAGFTAGCRGCAWLQDRVGSRVAHNTACRERMETVMMQRDTGKER